jgi:hypothetical protein
MEGAWLNPMAVAKAGDTNLIPIPYPPSSSQHRFGLQKKVSA